jgi:hypothetical protein
MVIPLPGGPIADPWALSLAYVAALVGGLVLLTFAVFQRQDLN